MGGGAANGDAALALHLRNRLPKEVEVDGQTVKPEVRRHGSWDVAPSFGLSGVLVRPARDIIGEIIEQA